MIGKVIKNRREQIGTGLAWDAPWQRRGHPEAAEAWLPQLEQEVQTALAQGQSHFCHFERAGQACYGFIAVLTPPPNLVLVGAGKHARVLARMAEPLGLPGPP